VPPAPPGRGEKDPLTHNQVTITLQPGSALVHLIKNALVAQRIEQRTSNPQVVGSTPTERAR
jgi:hypothetical protein